MTRACKYHLIVEIILEICYFITLENRFEVKEWAYQTQRSPQNIQHHTNLSIDMITIGSPCVIKRGRWVTQISH